jgi:hypothetical protein
MLLCHVHGANAAEYPRDVARTGVINHKNFEISAGFTLVGSAAQVQTSDGYVLRLVSAQTYKAGAAYRSRPVVLGPNGAFETSFRFRATGPASSSDVWADGMTFVLAKSPAGLGSSSAYGGYLGYAGVGNSVAVELDTFSNSFDSKSNEVAVDLNGDVSTVNHDPSSVGQPFGQGSACRVAGMQPAGCLADGSIWSVRIRYDGKAMHVRVVDGSGAAYRVIPRYNVDILSALGGTTVYAGFTAGTGADYANFDLLSWYFAPGP